MSGSHFDEIATVYDESLPLHVVEHYLRKRTAFLTAVAPPGRALDVGCGTGTLAERMAAAGYQVTGVDPSDGMLEILRRRAPMVEAVQGSGMELPFDADCFDLVFTVATLHHIAEADDVRRTLEEMVRVCRPAGRVVVWDHNPRNPYWSNLMARVPQDTGDERLIGTEEIFAGLRGAGARVLSFQPLGFVPDFTPRGAMRPAAVFERLCERAPLLRRFAAHNVVVAAKQSELDAPSRRELRHDQSVG